MSIVSFSFDWYFIVYVCLVETILGENVRNIVTYSIDNIKAQNCALEFHTFCSLDNLVLSLDILVALWYLNWPERCSCKLSIFMLVLCLTIFFILWTKLYSITFYCDDLDPNEAESNVWRETCIYIEMYSNAKPWELLEGINLPWLY